MKNQTDTELMDSIKNAKHNDVVWIGDRCWIKVSNTDEMFCRYNPTKERMRTHLNNPWQTRQELLDKALDHINITGFHAD